MVLGILGGAALFIGLCILVLGAAATAGTTEVLFALLAGPGPAAEAWSPTMDSELRFYAALWGAYGILALRAAFSLPRTLREAPWFAAVFFAGGVGRLLSRLALGPPRPAFVCLTAIELAAPPLMLLLWRGARSRRGG
jgi:hypothetical protein